MTTTDTEADAPDVDTATADLDAAKSDETTTARTVADLEAAVVAGDTDVTPEQITQAEGLSRIAKLRVKAAANRLAKAKAADAKRRRAQLAAHVDAFVAKHGAHGTDVLDVALEKFRAAVTDAAAECMATASDIRREYKQLVTEARELDKLFAAVPESARSDLGAPRIPSQGAERVRVHHDRPAAQFNMKVSSVAGGGMESRLGTLVAEAVRAAVPGAITWKPKER